MRRADHLRRRGLPLTLWHYIGQQYFVIFLSVLIALLSLVYVFEVVELLRRAASKENTDLLELLQMGIFKLPEVGMRIFPFAILFAGLICFWRLARSHELIVLRASGVSAWEFAMPAMAVAAIIAVLKITALNPIGAFAFGIYQDWNNHVLRGQTNTVAFTDSGLWLRQANADNTEVVIHARNINQQDWVMRDVMVLRFDNAGRFLDRLDAPSGRLIPGTEWQFDTPTLSASQAAPRMMESANLATQLTPSKIEEQYTKPDAVSFWALPDLISAIARTGLTTTRLELHYYSLLSEPLLFMGIALLAVAFALRHQRGGGAVRLILVGLVTGFALFFLRDLMRALASADIIPLTLAAWTPALLAVMMGASILLYAEDG
jgi:lipopolysaccharide export system permease protein